MSGALLITGANGFLGRRCVERFAQSGKDVVAVWHNNDSHVGKPDPANIRYERCDLTDSEAVKALFTKLRIESVLHTAAVLLDGKAGFLHRAVLSNVLATANLAEAAADIGCRQFVYCSSISVYEDLPYDAQGWTENVHVQPKSYYGWSKYAGEECVRLVCGMSFLRGIALRLAGIHGSGRMSGCVYHMMRAAARGEPVMVNSARQRFQLLFIEDAVDALQAVFGAEMPESFQCMNIASHLVPKLSDLAERIIDISDSRSEIRFGNTIPGGEQIMNVDSMMRRLAPESPSLDSRLRHIHSNFSKVAEHGG